MRAVFDTNILVDYLKGVKQAKKELALYEEKVISIITHIEVLTGAKNSDQEKILRQFLSTFTVVDVNSHIADKTITLRQELRLKVPDALIYATARQQGCMLVSRNTKDFKKEWPDVRVPYKL